MAVKLEMIANATSGTEFIALEDIPGDVKDAVEQILQNTVKNDCRTRLTHDTEDEGKLWFRQAASYAHHKNLKIRRSPTRDLPANVYDVRVSRVVAPSGKTPDKK